MSSRQLAPPSPLLALIDAAHGDWQRMFVWLSIALFVDTVDGPLARRVRVTEGLPRWSCEWLDLIVDYATYIGVPAFVLAESNLLPVPLGIAAAVAILLSSLFHMADLGSNKGQGHFVGFPPSGTLCCSICSPSRRRP
jgi:phosphatidylcholine synthase